MPHTPKLGTGYVKLGCGQLMCNDNFLNEAGCTRLWHIFNYYFLKNKTTYFSILFIQIIIRDIYLKILVGLFIQMYTNFIISSISILRDI